MAEQSQTYDGQQLLKHIKEIINNSETSMNITSLRQQLRLQKGIEVPFSRLAGFLDCASALGRVIIVRPSPTTSIVTNSTMVDKHIQSPVFLGVINEKIKLAKDENQSSITEY